MSGTIPSNSHADATNRSPETRRLERQSMRNWYLLASFCAVSTIGLLIAVTPALRQSIAGFWPWAATDIVLLVGLGGSILLLVLHMTFQQLKVTSMRHRVQYMETKALERRRQNASRFHALLNVSRMMGAISDLPSLFDGLTKTCLEIFDCQQASVMLLNSTSNMLELKAAAGHVNMDKLRDVKQPVGKGIAGYVAKMKKPVILGSDNSPENYPGLKFRALNLTAAMVVPIMVRDELVGVLNISSRVPGSVYTADDLQALEIFAENAGTCIRQAERAEWMRQTIERQQRQMGRERQNQPV